MRGEKREVCGGCEKRLAMSKIPPDKLPMGRRPSPKVYLGKQDKYVRSTSAPPREGLNASALLTLTLTLELTLGMGTAASHTREPLPKVMWTPLSPPALKLFAHFPFSMEHPSGPCLPNCVPASCQRLSDFTKLPHLKHTPQMPLCCPHLQDSCKGPFASAAVHFKHDQNFHTLISWCYAICNAMVSSLCLPSPYVDDTQDCF